MQSLNVVQTYGEFNERLPRDRGVYFQIEFSPADIPLEQRWRNNGLSADYMADYCTTFFPVDPSDPDSVRKQREVKHAIGYIANELLENATKFNEDKLYLPIRIALHNLGDRLVFLATNNVSKRVLDRLRHNIEEISNSDPDELYLQQLERNALDENEGSSGIGFLSMIVDYFAKIAWKLEPLAEDPQMVTVTTLVELGV